MNTFEHYIDMSYSRDYHGFYKGFSFPIENGTGFFAINNTQTCCESWEIKYNGTSPESDDTLLGYTLEHGEEYGNGYIKVFTLTLTLKYENAGDVIIEAANAHSGNYPHKVIYNLENEMILYENVL